MTDRMLAHTVSKRDLRVHPYLWKAAGLSLERCAEKAGSFYEAMMCMVFCAFTFEAYINWLGSKLFSDWNSKYERALSTEKKLDLICAQLCFGFDSAQRPWKTMEAMKDFRDDIAHGKSLLLTQQKTQKASAGNGKVDMLRSRWELFSTSENAVIVRADLEEMVTKLHLAANLSGESSYPFAGGLQETDTFFEPMPPKGTRKKISRAPHKNPHS